MGAPVALAVPSLVPLVTDDADVVLPRRLARRSPEIGELLDGAGFEKDISGGYESPVVHYRPRGQAGFYAEFLALQVGAARDRKGRSTSSGHVAGVAVQRLRHLDILLVKPWTITL